MTPPMSSSKFLGVVTPADAERFVDDWANLEQQDIPRFLMRHSAFIPDDLHTPVTERVLIEHRDKLRKAWDSQNPFHRNWYLAHVQLSFSIWSNQIRLGLRKLLTGKGRLDIRADKKLLELLPEPPAKPSPVDAALEYLKIVIADRAKHCGNMGCERPYFIGEKRWQRYCKPSCARPAVLAAKRKWFENEGQKRRARGKKERGQ